MEDFSGKQATTRYAQDFLTRWCRFESEKFRFQNLWYSTFSKRHRNRMKIENIDIQATIEKAQALVRDDEHLAAATKSMFEILILVITLLACGT
jgi:hypothetical protein